VVPRTTLADLDDVNLELRIFRGHFVQLWAALYSAFVSAQLVPIYVSNVRQLDLAADRTRDVRVLAVEFGSAQQIWVGIAYIGHGRTASEDGGKRRPPGQPVVHDRSPHARQVTTELSAAGDPAGQSFGRATAAEIAQHLKAKIAQHLKAGIEQYLKAVCCTLRCRSCCTARQQWRSAGAGDLRRRGATHIVAMYQLDTSSRQLTGSHLQRRRVAA